MQADVKMLVSQFDFVHEEKERRKERERQKEKGCRRGKSESKSPHTGHDKQARSLSALPGARVQNITPHREESPFRQIVGNVVTYNIDGNMTGKGYKSDADSRVADSQESWPLNAARTNFRRTASHERHLDFERAIHASSVLPWVGVAAGGLSGQPGRAGGDRRDRSFKTRVDASPPPPVM